MSYLERAVEHSRLQHWNFARRYISRQSRVRPQLYLHPTLPQGRSTFTTLVIPGSTEHLRQRGATNRRLFLQNLATTAARKMASDGDYASFLDKANQDPNEGYAKPQSSGKEEFKATDEGASIPAAIQEATKDAFYMSDADEPFVPVCLAWDEGGKGLPDEEEFATLIRHPDPSKAGIEIQDPADWDTQGQYGTLLDAVSRAGKGNDVRVYRVARGGARFEYWVVTTDGKGAGARLVGAKALAIES